MTTMKFAGVQSYPSTQPTLIANRIYDVFFNYSTSDQPKYVSILRLIYVF